MRRKGSIEELEEARLLAARMFDEGLSPAQIARILDRDPQTVRHWRRKYEACGIEKLKGKPAAGAASKLTTEQKSQLIDLLGKEPKEYGLEGWLWTTKLVASLIQQQFNVEYHHDHIGVILREIGLSWQRPMHRAKERNEPEIQGWREQTWPALLKKVSTAEEPLFVPMKSDS